MTSLAGSERARLCDTALAAGAEAPTLCGDWTVRDLLVHLVVREQDPVAAPGIVLKPLAFLTERASSRRAKLSLTSLVDKVRRPPRWSPVWIGAVDRTVNTLEYFVHHEDIRRATPDWEPRRLTDVEQRQLWRAIGFAGRGLVRAAGVPVQIAWAGTDRRATLRSGDHPVTLTGEPGELVLFLYGRKQVSGVRLDGPPAAVAKVKAAELGL